MDLSVGCKSRPVTLFAYSILHSLEYIPQRVASSPLVVSGVGCLVLLDDSHGVEGVLLGKLGLDLGKDGAEVGDVLYIID